MEFEYSLFQNLLDREKQFWALSQRVGLIPMYRAQVDHF